jgi:hypothetical protein
LDAIDPNRIGLGLLYWIDQFWLEGMKMITKTYKNIKTWLYFPTIIHDHLAALTVAQSANKNVAPTS